MTVHPHPAVIAQYTQGGPGLDDATVWSVEAHLEDCPQCRAHLAGSTTGDTRALLDRVAAALDDGLDAEPAPARLRRPWSAVHRRWLAGALLPWLSVTVAVLACALLLAKALPELPSLVLLLAPLAPLPGVAAAWSRRADPAWELIAGTPAAGLVMLLRRTAAVLAVLVPALALAGLSSGVPLALMLLPGLACTAAVLALGGRFGVHRAALAVATVWAAAVVLPSVLSGDLPVVLQPGSVPVWALAGAALTALTIARSADYRRLNSRN